MTPTEELRRMLDELGVKYDAVSYDNVVFCGDAEYELYSDGHTRLIVNGATPEQAVAATVGVGTCKNVSDPPEGFLCSECGGGDFDEPTRILKDAKFCPNCWRRIEES